jgi:hypothetical protein
MTQVRPRAAVLATIAALSLAASAYFPWLADDSPRQVPLRELFLRPEGAALLPSYWESMAAPLVVAGAVGALGALLCWRPLLALSFLAGLATVGLWITTVLAELRPGEFVVGDVQIGAWISVGAILLLLLATIALRRRVGDEEEETEDEGEDEDVSSDVSWAS